MTGVPLFIAEPTGTCRLVLRRFGYSEYRGHRHDAQAVIAEDAPQQQRGPDGRKHVTEDQIPHDDPRWPATCGCGQPFHPKDQWQVREIEWYEGGGQRFAWGIGSWDGPPGAMIRAPWRDYEGRPAAWTVFLPNGTCWNTNDRPAGEGNRFGPYWEVAGIPPCITVHPSIDDRGSLPWHGWIKNGVMEPT